MATRTIQLSFVRCTEAKPSVPIKVVCEGAPATTQSEATVESGRGRTIYQETILIIPLTDIVYIVVSPLLTCAN